MREFEFSDVETLHRRRLNLATLEQIPALGRSLALAYDLSLQEAPVLNQVEIYAFPLQNRLKKALGCAVHPGATPNGQPAVVVNTAFGKEYYQGLLQNPSITVSIILKRLGVTAEEFSAAGLASFYFLHEMGNARNFLENFPSREEYRQVRSAELDSLPVPGVPPGFLSERAIEKLRRKDPQLSTTYLSAWNILAAQERAYRQLPTEVYPDQFATAVMHKYPKLIHAKLS